VVDFINEVEEELRKDEYNRLLRRYGPYILAVIVAFAPQRLNSRRVIAARLFACSTKPLILLKHSVMHSWPRLKRLTSSPMMGLIPM